MMFLDSKYVKHKTIITITIMEKYENIVEQKANDINVEYDICCAWYFFQVYLS